MTPTQFLDDLSCLDFPNTFNPYRHRSDDVDVEDAPMIRKDNLRKVLSSAITEKADILWIARDLGYRGGRRTGLALTDEAHLGDHGRLYKETVLSRSTRGPILAERTASIIWNMLNKICRPVFLWNIFPLHPYGKEGHMTNRCHTKEEARACVHYLQWLVDELNPKIIVGVGNEAQASLDRMSIKHVKARHPSYGGKSDFEEVIENTFDIVGVQDSLRHLSPEPILLF